MKRIIFTAILILAFCFAAFAQVNENQCPKISLTNTIPISEVPVKFTAETGNEIDKYNVEYQWKVKDGKIIEGQGTKTLKVLYYEKHNEVNTPVTLEIKGLPENCENTFSTRFYMKIVRSKPIKFWRTVFLDEYEKVTIGDEKARLDNFFITLQEDKTAEGFIRLQVNTRANLHGRLKRINDHLFFRRFNKTRISFAVVKNEKEQTQFWAVPKRAKLPNCENCVIVKAEEAKQKLRKLFPIKSKIRKRKK